MLLCIESEPVALDFDLAVSLRLASYDNQRKRADWSMLSVLLTGKELPDAETGESDNVEVW